MVNQKFASLFQIAVLLVGTIAIGWMIGGEVGFVSGESGKKISTKYTVVSGDQFDKIAHAHGMTRAGLMELNPKIDIENIDIGQELVVKSGVDKTEKNKQKLKQKKINHT